MIDAVLIALTALVASALTLFSGFGLSTVLMPVFALFFPAPVVVAERGGGPAAGSVGSRRDGDGRRLRRRLSRRSPPATLRGVQLLVAIGMILVGLGLAIGLV